MLKWAQGALANTVGLPEPIHGPEAIHSVEKQTAEVPYTELTKDDLKWLAMTSSCVETQTFYLMADSGHIGLVQVIYSVINGVKTVCQFNTKIFYPASTKKPHLWSTNDLKNTGFADEMTSFFADDVAVTLSEDGTKYTIKSMVNPQSIVNLSVERTSPGFQVGKDGKTLYGTDPKSPWGTMRHAFWPRCQVEGVILTQEGEVNMKGRGFLSHALQGMKPHHAAASWDFINFQTPTYSAVMMQYKTPPSYGSTVVNVGGIAKDGTIIAAGSSNACTHVTTLGDLETDWPAPTAIKFAWGGKTKDGQEVNAVVEGPLGERLDRVDVMAEVPTFLKAIAGNLVGTRPYIYQSAPRDLHLKLKIGGEEVEEKGTLFYEATFISEA